jgi:glycosyltransferase involved in cell wall biosynthesis
MREILFVSVHPRGRVPSQRFRFEQYVEFLGEHGFRTTFSSVLHPNEYRLLYAPGRHARKALIAARGFLRRLGDVARASRYDIIFVQREAIQLGTALFEDALSRTDARLVFDFDDAIWLSNASEANRRFAWLKRPGKTSRIISLADMVFAGNEYLMDYASQFNTQVKLVPTTIDTDRYVKGLVPPHRGRVCIGWSGSITTIQHFELMIPILRRLRQRFGEKVYFKVIGDGGYRSDELEIQGVDWNPGTEVDDLSELDIGLMPLPDDEWAKGKCALKGLQYMALGTPTVMSPVGVNADIIRDGLNGFLARSEDDWFEKLSRLIESPPLREELGNAARDTVRRSYSVESQKRRYVEYLSQVLEGSPTKRRAKLSQASRCDSR